MQIHTHSHPLTHTLIHTLTHIHTLPSLPPSLPPSLSLSLALRNARISLAIFLRTLTYEGSRGRPNRILLRPSPTVQGLPPSLTTCASLRTPRGGTGRGKQGLRGGRQAVRERKSDRESWSSAAPFGPLMLNKSAKQGEDKSNDERKDKLHDVIQLEGVRSSTRSEPSSTSDNACNACNDVLLRRFCTPRSSVSFTPRHLTLAAAVGAGGFGGMTLTMQSWGEGEELRTALGSSTEDTDDDQEEEGNHVRLISHHRLQPASPSHRLLKLEARTTSGAQHRHVRAPDRDPPQVDSDVHQVARLKNIHDMPQVPPLHLAV